MKILFTGGGTAGHILPIIAIAREIRRLHSKNDIRFLYIGPRDNFGSILLSQEGIEVKTILAGKIRRYFGLKSFLQNFIDFFFKIPIGFSQAFLYIFFKSPDLIFCKGGYGSLPSVFAGWILQVPIFLHESDISPGLSNRLLSRFSLEVFTSFPKTEYFPTQKMILIGNPIRREILEGSLAIAKQIFKLSGEKPIILIFGGSQGAQKINETVVSILPELLNNFEIIHQGGEKNFEQIKAEADIVVPENLKQYYHLFSFLKEEELKQAYGAADLIVGRAGSGTIFEIAALGKPSILIPLSNAAQNHQVKNAYSFAQKGACLVMEEENLSPHFFLEKLKFLISHPQELEKMKSGAKEFSNPQAAKIIAEYILSYLAS